ncbi:MAG: MarR family protein [bacterium ADurb.Bin157]|nr:MAG: MarR family protein [bacterium ADurb.Bin157]
MGGMFVRKLDFGLPTPPYGGKNKNITQIDQTDMVVIKIDYAKKWSLGITTTQYLIAAIIEHSGKLGDGCCLGVRAMAKELNCSPETVKVSIDKLLSLGIITDTAATNGSVKVRRITELWQQSHTPIRGKWRYSYYDFDISKTIGISISEYEVIYLLLSCARANGGVVDFSREKIADMLQIGTTTVSKVVKKASQLGLITLESDGNRSIKRPTEKLITAFSDKPKSTEPAPAPNNAKPQQYIAFKGDRTENSIELTPQQMADINSISAQYIGGFDCYDAEIALELSNKAISMAIDYLKDRRFPTILQYIQTYGLKKAFDKGMFASRCKDNSRLKIPYNAKYTI